MHRQFNLVERVKSYDPSVDEDLLNGAYIFSMKAHANQLRESGDPYFTHPLEVATILTHWKLDSATIATALLHDTIEDTSVNLQDIQEQFGDEVAFLVRGVTKLSKIELQSDKTKQAENFRKLVLAMSQDLRVLLVKLADRVHNMRTLHHVKSEEKRKRISRETMEIYAPLAERIGMHDVRTELEDLSFSQIYPNEYNMVLEQLQIMREKGEGLIPRIFEQLKEVLQRGGLNVTISGREKTPYSIWQKMQKKDVEFEQLSDIMAFRILVSSVAECYQALGTIHSTYAMVPGRFKDYISTPKSNLYQSLHSTVIGPENQRIEIQIRTYEMHEIAEMGVASHWQYKDLDFHQKKTSVLDKKVLIEGAQYRWVRSILDILEHASCPDEFLEHTKLEMFSDQVFCFTPKGDLINLPKGATPVDFAYAVHSKVGDHCVGAKINGRLVPLRAQLSNGDQVEIITSPNHNPLPAWERFVVTGRARASIRRFIHAQERQEYAELGRGLVVKMLRKIGLSARDETIEKIAYAFKYTNVEDFLVNVGKGTHLPREVLNIFLKEVQPDKLRELKGDVYEKEVSQEIEDSENLQKSIERRLFYRSKDSPTLPIDGLTPGMAVHYAGCCHPLPGETIVGIVTTGKGVTVHTMECESLKSFEEEPDRWIDLSWSNVQENSDIPHIGRLKVMLLNIPGSLGALSTVLGKMGANIANLRITHRTLEFYELIVDVEVKDIEHFKNVIASLRASKAVHSVDRR